MYFVLLIDKNFAFEKLEISLFNQTSMSQHWEFTSVYAMAQSKIK